MLPHLQTNTKQVFSPLMIFSLKRREPIFFFWGGIVLIRFVTEKLSEPEELPPVRISIWNPLVFQPIKGRTPRPCDLHQ